MNAGDQLHFLDALISAAGGVGQNIQGERKTGLAEEMQHRPGADQVMSKADGLLHAGIHGAGDAVMAKDNVAELAGNGPPDDLKGQTHIIDKTRKL